jgi:hypothetical protein
MAFAINYFDGDWSAHFDRRYLVVLHKRREVFRATRRVIDDLFDPFVAEPKDAYDLLCALAVRWRS